MKRPFFLLLALLMATPLSGLAQDTEHDLTSIEGIIEATYASIARAPGEQFNWDLFLSVFLEEATLISNTEQRQGEFAVLSPQDFVDWIQGATAIGGPNDRGFSETGYHNEIDRYGDIANVMSSYKKHFWGSEQVIGAGVNSFQLVWNEGRWWVVSIIWDEPYAAGPIPDKFGGMPTSGN